MAKNAVTLKQKRKRIAELNSEIAGLRPGHPLPDAVCKVREFILLALDYIDEKLDS